MEPGEPIRVAVFFATAAERARAEDALSEIRPAERKVYAGVIEGWTTPATVDELTKEGLMVDLIDERFHASLSQQQQTADPDVLAHLQEQGRYAVLEGASGGIVVRDARAENLDPRIHFNASNASPAPEEALESDAYFLSLEGPITSVQRRELEGLQVSIGAFLPPNRYRTVLTREQYARVRALGYVRNVTRYPVEAAVTPELAAVVAQLRQRDPDAPVPAMTFDCLLHRERDLPTVRALIEATDGATVIGCSNLRVRFEGPASLPLLAALVALPQVRKLAPYKAPSLLPT